MTRSSTSTSLLENSRISNTFLKANLLLKLLLSLEFKFLYSSFDSLSPFLYSLLKTSINLSEDLKLLVRLKTSIASDLASK